MIRTQPPSLFSIRIKYRETELLRLLCCLWCVCPAGEIGDDDGGGGRCDDHGDLAVVGDGLQGCKV